MENKIIINKKRKNNSINKKIKKVVKKDNKKTSGIRDLDKIVKNPEKYARKDVTIKRLVTILQKMSDQYYAGLEPYVDDDTFDIMVDVLRERDPNNSFLFQTGVTIPSNTDMKLPFSMPSLNKIKPGEKTLERWFNKYKGPYMAMDKLDGISVQIYKDNKGNIDMFTKKQTNIGTSKSYLLKYFFKKDVLDNLPNNTSIRGEVVISKSNFKKIKEFDSKLKNPRSAMAGLMNTEKIDERIAKKADVVMYNILSPRYTLSEQLKKLKKWGFKVVWNNPLNLENNNIEDDNDSDNEESSLTKKILEIETKLKNLLKHRIENSKYLVDGIVLGDDSKSYLHTEENPKYATAFKMNIATNMKDVKVVEVIWNATMYGYLQPTIRITPTKLSGNVTVTYVTAHNAKYVLDNKIGKGSIIKIVRSGDVIPYIVDVVKSSKKADMPNLEYMWNDTEVDIIVVDPPKKIKRIIEIKKNLHFFRKIGVKYLSDGLITKLYDFGYKTILSLVVAAHIKDVKPYDITGLGKKMIMKIYTEIDKAFENIKLPELMAGSLKFGRGLGVRKIRDIVKKYPDILDYYNKSYNKIKQNILEVNGFSEILAQKFAENLKPFYEFLQELKDNTDYNLDFKIKKVKKKIKSSTKEDTEIDMSGQKIVLTGFRSDKITDFIENNGGKITSSVSKNTTLVIYVKSEKLSSKLVKAKKLGIKLITRDKFEKLYNI